MVLLGKQIKALRTKVKMTQPELADFVYKNLKNENNDFIKLLFLFYRK